MSDNKLIIFTLETCGACRLVKKKLKQKKIEFFEIDIDKYPELWDKVVEQTNIDYVPTAYIIKGDENEGLIFSPGQDYEDADDLIKKISDNL